MDRLSSCYFCGAALDAQLSEYPVVPKHLQSRTTDSQTVVLCAGCRRKLGGIIESVVDAAESSGRSDEGGYEGTGFEPIADSGGDDDGDGTLLADDAETSDEREADPTAAGQTNVSGDGATDSADAESTQTDGDGPTLTKLEYNKVMRLLKNREFPVDRSEIREVATSAYQIDPAEFDAVIDAAIERDLLAVENGQFVDPEGR